MIRAAFLSFYRSLTRHPLYSALNLLGLSFGIAVFIVLSLFVRFETSYEQWLPNADRIYEIVHRNRRPQSPFFFAAPGYVLDAIRQNNPDLKATRLFPVYPVVSVGNTVQEETGQLVDPDFFRIFDLPVVAGDRNAALAAPDGLILSEHMARKYFGRANAVGETLDLRDDIVESGQQGKKRRWRVMAVVRDIPPNSTLKIDILRSVPAFCARVGIPYGWYSVGTPQTGRIFMELASQSAAETMPSRIWPAVAAFPLPYSETVSARIRQNLRIGIRPFEREHLASPHLAEAVSGLTFTAWLTLAVTMVNYANLAMARAGLRLREVAVRNIYGASIREIMIQLLVEAALVGGAGLIVAFSLVEIGLPLLNLAAHLSLSLDYCQDGKSILGLSVVVISSAVFSGLYPAGMLALNQRMRGIGASKVTGDGLRGRRLREGLSIAQFAVAGAFLIVLAGLAAQLRHMETSELGYSRDNLLTTDALITSEIFSERVGQVVDAWRKTSGIESVSRGQIPGEYYIVPRTSVRRAAPPGTNCEMAWEATSADFFKVYRTRLLAGRVLDGKDDIRSLKFLVDEESAKEGATVNIDIDMTAVKALGFSSPQAAIGQDLLYQLLRLHVVGVVADQRFQGPLRQHGPTLYVMASMATQQSETVIRYSGIDEATARKKLEAVWRKQMPDFPFVLHTMRQELDYYYRDDRRNTRLFAIGGGVAALIGAVGLFGMAAFNTSARVHEIGIRKAQGASRWRIMRLLMFQFLRPVLIANIIAWPIAYVVLDAWLKQFDDRVAMSPWFFLAGSGLSLLIAAATVFGVAWSGANLSPAKALRQL